MKLAPVRTPTALDYVYSEPPEPGQALAVAPGVLWLRMPLPFALDHINVWALEDEGGWTLVDCGLGNEGTRALWTRLLDGPLAGRPVKRVIVTHCHPDHIGLAAWLCNGTLQPWMTEAEFLHAHAVFHRIAGTSRTALGDWCRSHGLDEAALKALETGGDPYRRGVPELPQAFRCITDGEAIPVGSNTWRVIVGRGHSPEHAALYCETLGVLIAGDMLLPRISTNVSVWPSQPDADPLGLFLDSLTALERLPPGTLVLPSHGLPFSGATRRVSELRSHHQSRLDQLQSLCTAPRAAAQLLVQIFNRRLEGHHLVFALGETIAHLNYLRHRDAMERVSDGDCIRFVSRKPVAARQRIAP